MKLYSIYDEVAEEFGPLFDAKNDAVAIRKVKGELARHNIMSMEGQIIYRIGEFDSNDGKLIPEPKPFKVLMQVQDVEKVFNKEVTNG